MDQGEDDTTAEPVYVVSDLRVGGDEQLEEVPFIDECWRFSNGWRRPPRPCRRSSGGFGRVGTAIWSVLGGNVALTGLLVLVGVPLAVLRRDVRRTVQRFGVFETALTVDPAAPCKLPRPKGRGIQHGLPL